MKLASPGRALSAVLWLLILNVLSGCGQGTEVLTLATTTSTYDSGLLDVILLPFEQANDVEVRVLAVGTGEALALGQRGDADVILVHDRVREDKFVAQGYGVDRKDVMYNDFVIVGPASDPAGIKSLSRATDAFVRIAQTGRASKATFVSRGDSSGTHSKEKALWTQVDIEPEGEWYKSVGQGMGDTLIVANEMLAYTLSDRGTYLAMQSSLDLVILVQGDEFLFNPYGVIAVNPEVHPGANYKLALKFIDYITSLPAQEMIANFGVEKYGQPLFHPDSAQWHSRVED